jgi:hypothetical protein
MLRSNEDLHDYMVRLSENLIEVGQTQMGEKIAFAARFILDRRRSFSMKRRTCSWR